VGFGVGSMIWKNVGVRVPSTRAVSAGEVGRGNRRAVGYVLLP
jgi:hypothetical protein